MITDVFIKRYSGQLIRTEGVPSQIQGLFVQSAHLIFDDLTSALELEDGFFIAINRELSREIGVRTLIGGGTVEECASFLVAQYDLWNDAHGIPDVFIKLRLSFLELVFRYAEKAATRKQEIFNTNRAAVAYRQGWDVVVRTVIDELNARFREASMPLHYHNGLIQFVEDHLMQTEIAEPFWSLVKGTQWANVDRDLKEAIDRRDNNRRDSAGYAMRALESTIKIISDLKRWTTGQEKGASNFIDNLQSKRNGNLISDWEAEILRRMFKEIRNPLVHGEGSATPLQLTPYQTNWVIDSCMSWIKSLVLRV
jgi:hypothetical protein